MSLALSESGTQATYLDVKLADDVSAPSLNNTVSASRPEFC